MTRSAPVRRAVRIAADDESRLRKELLQARLSVGLSRATVGHAAGLSRTVVERMESGRRRSTISDYAAVGAAVGLDVRLRAYAGGDPIRDAAQQRLIERLRRRLHPSLTWSTEVALPIDGDRRAWDALIEGHTWRIGVEAETVLDDVQALERRLAIKTRDGRVEAIVLLISDTRRNRQVLSSAPAAFGRFDCTMRAALGALATGRLPPGDSIVRF